MTVWLARAAASERCGLIAGPTIDTRAIGEGTRTAATSPAATASEQRSALQRPLFVARINARTARSPRMVQLYHAFVKCTKELMNHQPHPTDRPDLGADQVRFASIRAGLRRQQGQRRGRVVVD